MVVDMIAVDMRCKHDLVVSEMLLHERRADLVRKLGRDLAGLERLYRMKHRDAVHFAVAFLRLLHLLCRRFDLAVEAFNEHLIVCLLWVSYIGDKLVGAHVPRQHARYRHVFSHERRSSYMRSNTIRAADTSALVA